MVHMRTVNSAATPDRGSGMAHQQAYRAAVGGKHRASKTNRTSKLFAHARRLRICGRRVFCGWPLRARQPRPVRPVRRHGRPLVRRRHRHPRRRLERAHPLPRDLCGRRAPTWNMTLTCASDAYKFNLCGQCRRPRAAQCPAPGARASRNVSGTLQGRGGGGNFQVVASDGRLQCQHLAARPPATGSRSRCGPTASSAAPISRCRSNADGHARQRPARIAGL